MEDEFDAVDMVRSVRDKIYEEIKNLDDEKAIAFLNSEGRKAEEQLRKGAGKKTGEALNKT